MRLSRRRSAALVKVVLSLAVVAGAVPAEAAAKCKSRGQAVIKQRQLIIYFVAGANPEYRGCDVATSRVTRLVTKGQTYSAEQVVAHGRHATVVETIDPFSPGPVLGKVVTIWDLRRGRVFAAEEIAVEPERTRPAPALVDSPEGDPVTAVSYLTGGKRVLDAVSNKGVKRLSDGKVKPGSIKVSERTIRWTEGSRRRSRKV